MASVKFENSHTEPVYKTIWTASKSGSEIMTGGSDGLVRWWDIRNFEKAKEELIVDVENKDPKSSGINTCLTMDTLELDTLESNVIGYMVIPNTRRHGEGFDSELS